MFWKSVATLTNKESDNIFNANTDDKTSYSYCVRPSIPPEIFERPEVDP